MEENKIATNKVAIIQGASLHLVTGSVANIAPNRPKSKLLTEKVRLFNKNDLFFTKERRFST